MKLKFETEKVMVNGGMEIAYITECPYKMKANSVLRKYIFVGEGRCKNCKYYDSANWEKNFVNCNYKKTPNDNNKLSTNEIITVLVVLDKHITDIKKIIPDADNQLHSTFSALSDIQYKLREQLTESNKNNKETK